jgi:hypothetical protein
MAEMNDNKINIIMHTSTKTEICKSEGVKRIEQIF